MSEGNPTTLVPAPFACYPHEVRLLKRLRQLSRRYNPALVHVHFDLARWQVVFTIRLPTETMLASESDLE